MKKFVPAAEPVPEPEPELAAAHLAPNDDDEENLEVGDDEPNQDGPAEEPDDDILPLEDEEDAASPIGKVNGSDDE